MIVDELNKILNENSVKNDYRAELKEDYRVPLESVLRSAFDGINPHIIYGGSLAKGTPNRNSCDMDLLCYFPADCALSVESIYNGIAKALTDAHYWIEKKNSAICVKGDYNNYKWDISVDVVPGKYTQNENNEDVFLWCNRDRCRLKSNPEKQIGYVKNSKYKDLIRLVKLYRDNRNFKFKSFYLEIFVIDYIGENELEDNDTIYDQLVKFSSHFSDIGKVSLFDPANSNNNISDIHDDYENIIIRNQIKDLYDALLTNDERTIISIMNGESVDLNKAYEHDAISHSSALRLNMGQANVIITCNDEKGNSILSSQIIPKNVDLRFDVMCLGCYVEIESVHLIISNAGYESICCPRGKEETTEFDRYRRVYWRKETTLYNGNHYVQAIVRLKNKRTYYSMPFIVKIRDY